jgi:enoyl-CoA hydratase
MPLVHSTSTDSHTVITLDDGKMNALSSDMLAALDAALDVAERGRLPVLLTGRPGVFSAGFDLKTMGTGGAAGYAMLMAGFRLAERLLSFPAPVVVACPGHALAMGAFLLLSADHRVGSTGAFKVGANEVAINLIMPFFGVEICRQRLTPAYFHRSVINAEIYRPEEALTAGFFDELVPVDSVLDTGRAVATRLGKLNVDVHTATKLRAREPALKAIRAAIEADDVVFKAWV